MVLVADAYHGDSISSFEKMAEAGIVGLVHKATQGVSGRDSRYVGRKPLALDAGLLWGAYHFNTRTSGVDQAEWFLDVVQPEPQTLLAFDWENNDVTHRPAATLQQAVDFALTVHAETGRWPVIYSANVARELVREWHPVLSQCPYWPAHVGVSKPRLAGGWPTWQLWQFSWTYRIAGCGPVDMNYFNGTEEELRAWWLGGSTMADGKVVLPDGMTTVDYALVEGRVYVSARDFLDTLRAAGLTQVGVREPPHLEEHRLYTEIKRPG